MEKLESTRIDRISLTNFQHKSEFGQYLTPVRIAEYMAELLISNLPVFDNAAISILDPGAGTGILSCVLADKLLKKQPTISIDLTAYEIDSSIMGDLDTNYHQFESQNCKVQVFQDDFIKTASEYCLFNHPGKYDLVIMNPPYKKIAVNSQERAYLRSAGIETVNLYSGFVGLACKLLNDNGLVAAIIPRSFCNGLYYAPFRKLILSLCNIKHIHIFESRKEAFIEESVLQENIIILLQKKANPEQHITISYSTDRLFSDYKEVRYPSSEIVDDSAGHNFIAIPNEKPQLFPEKKVNSSLKEIGLTISTGPIVDFRMRDALRFEPVPGAVPLIYPQNLKTHTCIWPLIGKKPTSIMLAPEEFEKLAFPVGYYVLIKRFSSKEEKRRVWVTLLTPDQIKSERFTMENHVNFIHRNRKGLAETLAMGLFVYLSSEYFDNKFRAISGSTQVNSTDLRNMPFPSSEKLEALGIQYIKQGKSAVFDDLLAEVFNRNE